MELLRADGRRCVAPLASLKPRTAFDGLCVGDLVRARDSDYGAEGPACGTPGTVLQVCEQLSGPQEAIYVRFPCHEGFRDVFYTARQAEEQLEVDGELNRMQPQVAVRLRGSKELGVVYALHGDTTVVVDFLSNWGHHCSVLELELVEDSAGLRNAGL